MSSITPCAPSSRISLVTVERVLDERIDVADVRVDALRVAEVFVEDLPLVEWLGAVQPREALVLETEHESELLLEERRLLQVADAKADAAHLVLVRRADAAPGGAEAVVATHLLAELVEHWVIRHHHVRPLADDEVLRRDPA